MLKQTPKKRVLFVRRFTPVLLALFGVFSLLLVNLRTTDLAYATAANTVNFQARLQTNSGAIVPDGDYNVEFKLYDAATSTGGSQGSCGSDTHCLWTETRTSTNKVTVKNGYLSVNLGSVTSFPTTIDWSQKLWLTMNIGGTGTASWDGEMNPRLPLTAVPYAFQAAQATQAGTLSSTNASGTSTLTFQGSSSGNQNFVIQDQGAAGTYNLLTNTSGVQLQSGTPGSAQTGSFNITGTGMAGVLQSTTLNAGSSSQFSVDSGGGVDINDPSDTSAFTIENTSGTFFKVNTSASQVDIGDPSGALCSGRLCVAQSVSGTGGSTYTNSYNIENISSTSNSNTIGQSIVVNDTSSNSINNTNTGLKIDFTGSTDTTSGYYGVIVKAPAGSTASNGNLIQLQNGTTNVFKITDGGGALLHSMGSFANAFEVQDSSGYDVFNVSTNGDYATLGNVTTTSGQGVAGTLRFADGTADGYYGALQLGGTIGSNQTYSLPTTGGTLCTTSTCAGSSGSGSYIQNGTSVQTGANFNVDGTGKAATLNATSGFQINGTAGATTTCTGGNVLGNITISGGIITGGSCATNGGGVSPTLQNVYDNSGSSTQIQLSSGHGLTLKDAASTVGNILQIQNSAATSTYFAVTSSGAVAANFNATTGYSVNGTAGANVTCSGGQFLQNQIVAGGIVTGGTCAAASNGVTAIGSLDGGTANATGATISGTTLYLQSASGTYAGLVNTATQTFAGAKTFSGDTLVKDTSSTAFQVTDASSNILFTADTSTGTITFGTGSNTVIFTASGGLQASGTAQHVKSIALSAEYAGAVLDAQSDTAGPVDCSANNSGTMTSGFDSSNHMNYYNWTSSSGTTQCYDVVAQVTVPNDWASWASSDPINIQTKTDNTSNSAVSFEILNGSGTADGYYNYGSWTVGTSWADSGSTGFNGTYTAGSTITFKIRLSAKSGANVKVGNITLNYNSKY